MAINMCNLVLVLQVMLLDLQQITAGGHSLLYDSVVR